MFQEDDLQSSLQYSGKLINYRNFNYLDGDKNINIE